MVSKLIPTAEEIAALIRKGMSAELEKMWYAGASSGLGLGLAAGLLIAVIALTWRKE